MSLDPRAVALQGVGYAPLLLAVQGFGTVEIEDEQEEMLIVRPVIRKERKKKDPRRDTDDDAIFMFLLN